MKFNNPALEKALKENTPRMISENELMDKVSEDIKLLERVLKTLCPMTKMVKPTESIYLRWDSNLKRIMCNGAQEDRPLLECKKEVRLACYPFLEELIKP